MKRVLLLLAACADAPGRAPTPKWVSDTSVIVPGAPSSPLADPYRATADKILAAARADRGAFDKLRQLTDHIGNRLSGSPALDKAIAWAEQAMKADGHDVHTEKVMVPHWQRGLEEAELIAPIGRKLHVIGLGGSVAGNVTAPVVVVHSWAELEHASVRGAIVLFDVAMPAYTEAKGTGYGETVDYRSHGAARAAKLGAVATLMRSVTAHSLRTLHAGAQTYEDGVAKIPTAAITVEDASLIARLAGEGSGRVDVHLHLEDQMLPDAPSANVVGELKGREHPEEIVVIGAHLDSWDVGQGAHDDGAGVVTCMEALTVLRKLGLQPRRTIRVVLFTNEENGLAGGKTYAKDHAAELPNTVAAIETDSGGFAPRGFSFDDKHPQSIARLGELATLLAPLNAARVKTPGHGADVSPMTNVLIGSLDTDNRTYFDIHHTEADTLDNVDPAVLADDVAAMAVMAYGIADAPTRLDR